MDQELSIAHGVTEETGWGSDPCGPPGMNSAARDEGGGGGGGVGGEGQSTETETIATEARGHMKKGAKGHGKKARGASAAGQAKSQHPPPEFAKEIRAWAERIQKRIEKRKFKLKLDFSAFKKLFRRRKKKKNAAKADQSTFATQTADGGASTGEDLESREERRHAMELFEKLLRDLMKGMSMEDLRYTSTGSLCSRRFSGDTLKSNPGVATLQRDAATSSGSVSTPGSQQSTMSRAMDPRSMQRAALTYLLMKLSHETNSNGGMSDSTEAIGDARAAELSQSALGVKANDDLERWCWEFLRSEGDVLDSSESDDGSEDECGTSGDASCLSGGTGKLSATGNEDQNLRRHSCSDVAGLKLTKMKGKQHLTRGQMINSKYSSLQEFPHDELDYREEELKSSGQSKFLTLESSALRDPVDGTGIAGHSNCTANGQEVDAHRISSEKINESANEQNNHSGADGDIFTEVNETLPSSGKYNKTGGKRTEFTQESTDEPVMACQNKANDGGNLSDEQHGSSSVLETVEEYSGTNTSSRTHFINNGNGHSDNDVDVDSESLSVGDGYVSVQEGSVIDSSGEHQLSLSDGESPNGSKIVCHTTNIRAEMHNNSHSVERERHFSSTENLENKTHAHDPSNVQHLLNSEASTITKYSQSSEFCPSENDLLISSSRDSQSDVVDFTAQNMEKELKTGIAIEENNHRSDAEGHVHCKTKNVFSYLDKQSYTDSGFKVIRNSINIEHTSTEEIASVDNYGHGEQPTASHVDDIQQEHNQDDLATGERHRTYDHRGRPVDTTLSGVQSRHESTFNVIVETRGHESDAFVPPVAGPAHAGENKLDGCRSPNGSENSEGALSETESVASSTVTSEERRWEAGVSAVQQGEERFGPPSGSRPGLYAKTEPLCRLTGEAAHSSRTSEESESEESLFSDHGEQSSAAVAQGCLHESKALRVVDWGTQTASNPDSVSPGAQSALSTDDGGLFQVSPPESEHWDTLGPMKTAASSASTQTIWLSHAECQTHHGEDLPGATGETAASGSRSSNLGRGVCWFIPADRVSNIHGDFTADGERLSHPNGPIPARKRRPIGPFLVISPKEALELRRPDFISRSNERQRWVSHLAEERQTEKVILRVQQQQRWLQQQQQKQIQRHGRLTDHITARQRKYHPAEETAHPRKNHEHFPDVKRRRQPGERPKSHRTSYSEHADFVPKKLGIQTSREKR
ncbi:uncharacterized protein LOC144717605 isoform X2 [Lampetra planeri]